MTYDLKLERLFDAPPELVFDTMVDPDVQNEIFTGVVEGWSLHRFDIDLRVGGEWTIVFGPTDGKGESDTIKSVFTEIDRPYRLVYESTMYVSEWGRTVTYLEDITLEDQGGGKTLVTVVESGFETEADRDSFLDGTPEYLDAVQRVVAARIESEPGNG